MEGRKAELLQRIESDREVLLDFFRRFIRCPSPNPPGDTREAAAHIRQFLARHEADCRVIAVTEAEDHAGAPPRPAPRTSEDYLRERETRAAAPKKES